MRNKLNFSIYFYNVHELLNDLCKENIITIENKVYNRISDLFKIDCIEEALQSMLYLAKRLCSFYEK